MHSLAVVTIYRVFYKFLGLNQSFLKLTPWFILVGRARFELATNGLKVRHSIK